MAAVAVRRAGLFLGRKIRSAAAGGDGGHGGFLGGGDGPAPSPAVAVAVVVGPQSRAARQETGPSVMTARITPAVLFITVVLAVVLLVSGLLHILRRLFLKSNHANARAEAMERQLQQLFHLHEDGCAGPGLDQADIDALPAFAYSELDGRKKRPFDCAVCLCEFTASDRLRLLPLCGHAFHATCIDTWLRSSSTCPLCRAALTARALAAATAAAAAVDVEEQKQEHDAPNEAAVVLPVRLGRFTKLQGYGGGGDGEASTSSCLDARRCYSMGSYQYVLADDNLMVSVHWPNGSVRRTAAGEPTARIHGQINGKKLCAASRGDSFSVSKIWQWRGGERRLPVLCSGAASPPADDGLPWARATAREKNGTRTRQECDTS